MGRAQNLGQIRGDVDLRVVVDQLWKTGYHRLLLPNEPLDESFATALVRNVTAGTRPDPRQGAPGLGLASPTGKGWLAVPVGDEWAAEAVSVPSSRRSALAGCRRDRRAGRSPRSCARGPTASRGPILGDGADAGRAGSGPSRHR